MMAAEPKRKGEVTLAREAADRLSEWLSNPYGSDLSGDDIAIVLAHYRKLTRKRVSAKGRYVKGRSYEYEVRDYFIGRGLHCRRVAQSGGGTEKDDLVLTTGFGAEYRLELKRVAKLPAYLVNEAEATVFRCNNGQSFVLTTLERFADHCQ